MVTHIFGGPTREILSASLSLQNHPKTQGRRQLTIVRLSFFFFGCSFFLALVFFFFVAFVHPFRPFLTWCHCFLAPRFLASVFPTPHGGFTV